MFEWAPQNHRKQKLWAKFVISYNHMIIFSNCEPPDKCEWLCIHQMELKTGLNHQTARV